MVHRLRSVDKEEFWRWHVEMQAAEGLSARAYCRQQGLSAASFYAWRRELKRRDDGRALSPCSEKQAAAKQNAAGDRLVNRTHFGAENGPTWETI